MRFIVSIRFYVELASKNMSQNRRIAHDVCVCECVLCVDDSGVHFISIQFSSVIWEIPNLCANLVHRLNFRIILPSQGLNGFYFHWTFQFVI